MNVRILVIAYCLFVFTSISAQNKWGAWGEAADEIDIIRLEDYDRFYDVTIGIDTVMQLVDRDFHKRLAAAHIPFDSKKKYKINERYRVFYLWKNRFIVRFVVTEDSIVSKKEVAEKKSVKLFDAKPFRMQYDCRCLENEELILQNDYNPDYFTPDYFHTKLGVAEGDSLRLYNYFQMQILQVDTARHSADCPPMYHIINPYQLPYSYVNIREERTVEDVIHNYIYNKIFVNNKVLVKENDNVAWQNTDGVTICYLLPKEIPPFEETLTYQNCLKENSTVTISTLNDMAGKSMYRVNNTFPYIDRQNVMVSYNLLYIPEVLYFSEPKFNYWIKIK